MNIYLDILIILLLFFIGIYLLYISICKFRFGIIHSTKNLGISLSKFKSENSKLHSLAKNYSSQDPDPYGSIALKLESQMLFIHNAYQLVVHKHSEIIHSLPELSHNRFKKLWEILVSQIWQMILINRDLRRQWQEIQNLELAYKKTNHLFNELREQSWKVALKVRFVLANLDKAMNMFNELIETGVHGQTFTATKNDFEQLYARFKKIPHYFINGHHDIVISRSDKQIVIEIYNILTEAENQLFMLSRLEDWRDLHVNAKNIVTSMHQTISLIEKMLNEAPHSINFSSIAMKCTNLREQSIKLNNLFRKPDLEEISDISKAAKSIEQDALQLLEKIELVKHNFITLKKAIISNKNKLNELVTQIKTINEVEIYPIIWCESEYKIKDLEQKLLDIGSINKNRTPDQIDKGISILKIINDRFVDLAKIIQKRAKERELFIELWSSNKLGEVSSWLDKIEILFSEVSIYSFENWDSEDFVNQLLVDTKKLYNLHKSHIPSNISKAIEENLLDVLLTNTNKFISGKKNLNKRVNRIRVQLDEIKGIELKCFELIDYTKKALERMISILESDSYFNQYEGKNILELLNKGEELLTDLQNRKHGIVVKKSKQIEQWHVKVGNIFQEIFSEINTNVNKYESLLNTKLLKLKEIAPLNKELAVINASNLINSRQKEISKTKSTYENKYCFHLEELVENISDTNTKRQFFFDIVNEIEKVESEISGPFKAMKFKRKKASEEKESAEEFLINLYAKSKVEQIFLPNAPVLRKVLQSWEEAEKKRIKLSENGAKVLDVKAELPTLNEMYGAVAEDANKIAEQIQNIIDLMNTLNNKHQQWNIRKNELQSRNFSIDKVNSLLSDINPNVILRNYITGNWKFSRAKAEFEALILKADNININISHNQIMNINGIFEVGQDMIINQKSISPYNF